MTTDADPHANDAAQREWVARDTDHDESRRVHGVDRTRGSSGMTRPLVLGIAGLAGLGLVLALRSRERATADLPQHPYPSEGDDGLPPVDAGLLVCHWCATGWSNSVAYLHHMRAEHPAPMPAEPFCVEGHPRAVPGCSMCDWKLALTHSSYHDGRQA